MKALVKLSIVIVALAVLSVLNVTAQESSLGDQVTKKVGLYVFPAKGQTQDQQAQDESDCYKWAVQQSGVDPLNPPKVEAEQAPSGPDGSAVVGAAGGAAAGAAIGAICGDAGKGAAVGAVAGAVRGRRVSAAQQSQAQAANNQKAAQTQEDMMNNFKNAYTACLEGKGYTVK